MWELQYTIRIGMNLGILTPTSEESWQVFKLLGAVFTAGNIAWAGHPLAMLYGRCYELFG